MWKVPVIKINDNGNIIDFGSDVRHHTLLTNTDKSAIRYYNLQNGTGTAEPDIRFATIGDVSKEPVPTEIEYEIECELLSDYVGLLRIKEDNPIIQRLLKMAGELIDEAYQMKEGLRQHDFNELMEKLKERGIS